MLATLLLAVGSTAWADGNKRVLYSQDYESAIATDWTCPNATAKLTTGDAPYGTYAQNTVSGNGNRSCYMSVSYTADGFTAADLATAGYNVEFDLKMSGGNVKDRSEQQFVVPTTGPNLANNSYYSGEDYIFSISQPRRDDKSRSQAWCINDLTNTASTVTLEVSKWYHVKLVVTAAKVDATITQGETVVTSVSKAVTSMPTITGFFGLLGRGSGDICFDNLSIYEYVDMAVANVPTVTLTKVDGAKRIYTATIQDGETLHYIVPGGTEQTSASAETEITVTTDGDLQAWATNGAATSEKVTVAVTTGEVSLATPAISIVSIGEGAEKSFNVTCDNSNVLLKPTATITYDFVPAEGGEAVTGAAVDGTITATAAGTYTFTATAEGYTSSQLTFENKAMILVTDVDVTALDPTTVSSNWTAYAEARTVGSSSQWARYFTEALDGYWYNFGSETAAADDILPGLTLEIDDSGKTPQLFNTLGLMYPVHVLNADGTEASSPALTTMKIGIANPEGKIAIITYRPGYSNNNYSTVVLSGSQTWSMNRFDKAITSYKVYTEQKPLYLETDLTAQFTALTNPVNWVNAIGASTMAYAGWAAPQVTVNGNKVALVESYGEGQEFKLKTGDVMYQTITGLTPGTYAIELYGSANLTAGRAGMTTDFAEGDEQSKKAAYLYAEAGGTVTKTYIPAIIESDMNNRGGEEAIPTAKLEGIVVGDDGTVKVGLAKELGFTNWHFVQLKSVIAQVDAELLYANLIEKPMNAGVKAAMTAAITAARLDQSEENMTALNDALTAAQASAAAYEPLVENLEAIDDVIDNCVEYGATDTSAYDEIAEAAANGTYEDSEIEGVLSSLRDIVIAIVKQQTKEGADFTPVIAYTWVGQSGNYLFQGEYYAERWNGSLYTGDVMTQTVDGLPNGKYEITLRAAANVAWVTGNTGDDLTELFANNSKQNITVGSLTELGDNDFNTYTIEGIVTDGTLTYGLRNIAEGGNWFVIDALGITYLSTLTVSSDVAEALEELNAAIEHAIEVLADNVASPEAEDALLDVIDEADALYKKGKKGDQEVTPAAIAEMIQRLQDAEAAYLKDAETYDPTTAISSLNADGSRRSVYTIGGQKVDGKLQKGVYIVNGRKVVIK